MVASLMATGLGSDGHGAGGGRNDNSGLTLVICWVVEVTAILLWFGVLVLKEMDSGDRQACIPLLPLSR